MVDVVVYSTPTCPWCVKAKQFFKNHTMAYRDVDVTTDAAGLAEMQRISGQLGVPVIKFGATVVVGFDLPKLEKLVAGEGGAKA
jgi:glutaredoxin-like YruB-family protein